MEIVEIKEFSQPVLAAMNRLLPQLSSTARRMSAADLTAIVGADASHLYMAKEADDFPASLTLVIFDIPSGRRARIEDLVVDQHVRGKGIGRQLMAHALRAAQDLGAHSVDLVSNPSRTAAGALYLKMGFQQKQTHVYRLFLPLQE